MKVKAETLIVALLSAAATSLYYTHYAHIQKDDVRKIAEKDSAYPLQKEEMRRLNPYSASNMFYYDDGNHVFFRKTESYMPYMPALDGHMQTHATYRFLSVREQVLTVIGEAKHGLWREQDNGIIRLYRKEKATGVPVGANVYNPSHYTRIKNDYKANLIPGVETIDAEGWAGYRFAQEDDGDGKAAFVDVDIYHPYFEGKYDDHPVIDLPQFICTMSDYNYLDSKDVWNFVKKQRNANKIGPLGIRAGLDIDDLYTDVIKIDFFPDANMWIQVGQKPEKPWKDIFNQKDIDSGKMTLDVAYRTLDKSKVDFEVYLVERTSWNVPYIFITVVVDNKENDDLQYVRPNGLYWDAIKARNLHKDVKTEVTYNPVMPIIEKDGCQVDRKMRLTPLSAMNILDGKGRGNWCPQRGGDWAFYPDNPAGSGWPNQYEEVTPVCDGFVVDVKLFANLDAPSWESTRFQLQNAGIKEKKPVYIGEGNQYGEFTDPYLIENGFTNPHALYFTDESNPTTRPLQGITVKYEEIGRTNRFIHPTTGALTPNVIGPNKAEREERAERIAAIEFP